VKRSIRSCMMLHLWKLSELSSASDGAGLNIL